MTLLESFDRTKEKIGILLPKLFWPTVRKIILVIKKNFWNSWPSASNLQTFEITRTIYSNSERSEQFLVTECFFTCSWRFLRSQKIEQYSSNWKKWLGFRNLQEKLENTNFVLKFPYLLLRQNMMTSDYTLQPFNLNCCRIQHSPIINCMRTFQRKIPKVQNGVKIFLKLLEMFYVFAISRDISYFCNFYRLKVKKYAKKGKFMPLLWRNCLHVEEILYDIFSWQIALANVFQTLSAAPVF